MAKTKAEALARPIKPHDPEETTTYIPAPEVADVAKKYLKLSSCWTDGEYLERHTERINRNGLMMQRELLSLAFPRMDNATKKRALDTIRFIDIELGERNE